MSIRAGDDWKATLYSKSKGMEIVNQEYDPTPILVAQRHDIISLWQNDETQQILAKRRPLLRRSSGL
jgi:guanine nucleotide-binding protein subunit alpha